MSKNQSNQRNQVSDLASEHAANKILLVLMGSTLYHSSHNPALIYADDRFNWYRHTLRGTQKVGMGPEASRSSPKPI